MFNALKNLGLWQSDNPMTRIRVFPVAERELSLLTDAQIQKLLTACIVEQRSFSGGCQAGVG